MTAAGSQSPFQIARRKFVDACTAYAQQASDIEASMLEERVRSSLDFGQIFVKGGIAEAAQAGRKSISICL